jgi:exopolysaccharide biosynthesis polyprenyl glycosylphosphotransferase
VEALVRRHRVHRVIVAMPERRRRLPVTALLACRVRGIRIDDGTEVYERLTRRLAVEALTPGALVFGDGFRVSRARLALKRGLSVLIAATALMVSLPLMTLIALAITVDSRGPVFFVQERLGENGRPFRMLKFRSMVVDAEARLPQLLAQDQTAQPGCKLRHDPRVTRVGRLLRRTSLDELPQLWNVWRGEMSLVGPRPEETRVVLQYSSWQRKRLAVKPGLTGPMQVSGRGDLSLDERVRLELRYIQNYSLWEDLRLLARTVPAVLSGRGSY